MAKRTAIPVSGGTPRRPMRITDQVLPQTSTRTAIAASASRGRRELTACC